MSKQNDEAFVIRLQEEKNEICKKMMLLRRFIGSEKFQELSGKEQHLLRRQHACMWDYYEVLIMRCEFYGKKEGSANDQTN